jgi:hypothetical protein
MTCSECQVQIFDGELSRDAVTHLGHCEDCRALHREVQLNSAALAELRYVELPARLPRRPWRRYLAVAATIAVVIGAGVYSRWPLAEPASPVPSVAAVEPPVLPASPPVEVAPKPAPAKVVKPARVAKPEPQPPTLVKFLTDDPDVVIYWLMDPVQGEQAL